ncbi:keratin-associated protein 6-2-like [Lingula anatina]|uniref:Keratin-associated protein 6-2-like n=1 Tax=Lingula anatina TaxID=7574 RepID=A0A1S3ILI2_LINAN|nr:keratin-associated protein 6-2-like [Lingula anatina]|eukprot:XP_013398751.1 keratin-associated protein 6-2-like [Lingula anatina]
MKFALFLLVALMAVAYVSSAYSDRRQYVRNYYHRGYGYRRGYGYGRPYGYGPGYGYGSRHGYYGYGSRHGYYGYGRPYGAYRYRYHGKYPGRCGPDGVYARSASSLVFCSNGRALVQNCAPGSAISKMQLGKYYSMAVCDVNLVNWG